LAKPVPRWDPHATQIAHVRISPWLWFRASRKLGPPWTLAVVVPVKIDRPVAGIRPRVAHHANGTACPGIGRGARVPGLV